MNFEKLINDMQDLQSKIKVYETKNKQIEEAISSINKEILKLEKKIEKEDDTVEKQLLILKTMIMKSIIDRFIFERNDTL